LEKKNGALHGGDNLLPLARVAEGGPLLFGESRIGKTGKGPIADRGLGKTKDGGREL